jgi:hypothetical protein
MTSAFGRRELRGAIELFPNLQVVIKGERVANGVSRKLRKC